jgi:phosphoribosylamine--glycine ligase
MGAYAPAPVFTAEMLNEAMELILKPAVNGLKSEGIPFVGVLYAGLILTGNGLRVLEFNCRFGDPETQVVLPLLETDLLEIAGACVNGTLASVNVQWKKGSAVCVVLASRGYPEKVESGKSVRIESLAEDIVCFHAGTKMQNENVVTSGGRVLGLTAWAGNIDNALKKVYSDVHKISFEGMQFRKDIAHRALSKTGSVADPRKRTDYFQAEKTGD